MYRFNARYTINATIYISIFIGNTCYGLYRYATNVVDLSYYMNRKKLLINLLKYSYIDLTLDI